MDVPLDFVVYYDSINVPGLQNTIYTILMYVVYLQTYIYRSRKFLCL